MPPTTPSKPNTQTDDDVEKMTDAEFAALLATGWTPQGSDRPIPE